MSIRETKTRYTKKSEYSWDSYSHSQRGLLEIKVGSIKKRDAKISKLESFIATLAETAIKQMKDAKALKLAREEKKRRYAFISEYLDARNKQKRHEKINISHCWNASKL